MNEQNNEFRYTYSAKEQTEVKKIREKYETRKETKLECVRRLDRSVTQTAQIVSLTIGILGTLIMGFGMSMIMTEMRTTLGMSYQASLIAGIVIGVVGCAVASIAYPIYLAIVKHMRRKLAPEILRLTDELMK